MKLSAKEKVGMGISEELMVAKWLKKNPRGKIFTFIDNSREKFTISNKEVKQ